MQTYLVLLRGINVGGHNMIDMARLRTELAGAGFTQVRTYINSGNVILASPLDAAAVRASCEALIVDRFGLTIAVAVLSAAELTSALATAPPWWGSTADFKHNAIFVIPPATAAAVSAELGADRPDGDQVDYRGNIVFWSTPRALAQPGESASAKRATQLKLTVRNATTVFKLAALVAE